MDQPVAVLRQHEVRMGGICNVGQPVPRKKNKRNIGTGTERENAGPQAKIIQQTANQTVIEITCGCGCQILLQCEIDSANAPAQTNQPNPSEAEQPADT